MTQVTLGKTGITVQKNGFGALPIQRVSKESAVRILQKAYNNGITFFDTARAYSDSEEKLGEAFKGIRHHLFISTKTHATSKEVFWKNLETSLRLLQTDYIDILQFHNPDYCPRPGDAFGLYDAAVEAKKQGKIRFIGITNHRLPVADEATDSGLYDTLQYPFSYLSSEKETELVNKCKREKIGFIAMKALSGGLITHSDAAYAYMDQFDNVLPIWGIQRESELDEFLSYIKNPPAMTDPIRSIIEKDQKELSGNFCRGCGYCMPCPMDIQINTCARMSLLIRRAPTASQLTEKMQAEMKKVESCLHCNKCVSKCPYNLDTPRLLEESYKDYQEILAGKEI